MFVKILLPIFAISLALYVKDVSGVLGADPESLMRIVQKLCIPGGHDENFAMKFYDCYNLIPKDEKCLFDKCQKMVFGNPLDSKAHIQASCESPKALPIYQQCLFKEFEACKKDIIKSVTTINICQGRLLGLE